MDRKRLDHYEILNKLGEGGMGEVWRARDSQLNRLVAIKILPDEVWNDSTRRARFEQEARSLGALNHPNIVAVYGAGADNGCAYMVSELVDGESLRAIINGGRLPARKLIDIAVQIAEAIAAAHAAGIVHRDLKPENIMAAQNGRVKVLDFGLAKQKTPPRSDTTATAALSQPGMVMGTVGYMSPEQVRGESVDHRSDIFSFGAVLYEMICGKRAFQAPSSVETMNAILRDDPPDIRSEGSPLPPALETILRRCLEKRPEDRFQSAADLAFSLRAITPSGLSASQQGLAPVRQARPAHWWWTGLVAFAALALFATGWFVGRRGSQREPPSFQRITFRKGLVTNARFTPDGRNVIYSANWDNDPGRVYFAVPGSPEARDLGLPDNSIVVSVSSRDEVAYITGPFLPDGSGTLGRASISGGQMRPWLNEVRSADWSPDGSSMAVLRAKNAARYRLEYPIGKVLIDDIRWPYLAMRISPDGSRIAFVHFYKGSSLALSIVDSAGKAQMIGQISDQIPNRTDPMIAWSPNGREIWYRSFDPNQWGAIYAIDMKGRQRVLMRVPAHATLYDVAHDGRILLRTDSRQLGILGVGPGETQERDLSCLDMSSLTGISEDGTVIASGVSGESGGPKGSVYLRKTDGSPCIRIGDGAPFSFSPDGKWVAAFTSPGTGTRRYVLLPAGAGDEREIAIAQLKNLNMVYGWSRDNTTFFVFGPDNHGGWRHYVWNAASGVVKPIGPDAMADALGMLSPDRQKLLVQDGDERWWIYPVDGGAAHPVPGLSAHDAPRGWCADGHSLYIVTHHDTNKTLPVSVLDLANGKMTPWKEIHPSRPVEQVANISITPDGRAYAYNFLLKTSDLYIAEGAH